jgi:two-component system cell cycle sensor histidine kinase/response regulator CckA
MSDLVIEERIARARRSAAQFDTTDELVAVVGEDGLVLHLSESWGPVFKLPIESMAGTSFDEALSQSQVEIVEAESGVRTPLVDLIADSRGVVLLRCPDPEADHRMLEGRSVIVLADSRDHLMIFRDTTSHWRALTTLTDNEKRFRIVAEASRDMVTETDHEGRFIYASSACEKVLGYKPEELVGTAPLDLMHSEETDEFLDFLRKGRKTNEPFSVPAHRLLHRDGSQIWVEATGLIYWNSDGLQRTIGVARDITQQIEAERVRQNLEERVLRSQKLESLGGLAGGIAHDFNNLLTPIIGNVGLALLDVPDDSPARKRIEMIRVAADRATALTRQMLAYAGQAVPSVEAVSITTAIEEMALLIETTASKSTQLVYELQDDLPLIEVDNTHIAQITMSLVANASESFSGTGGRIEIRTGSIDAEQAYLDSCFIGENLTKGVYVYLEVIDDGPGISDEDRNRIFDPFFTTRFTGRGLGLSAVDGIVRGYKGALDLVSEIGQGTRIRVLFPAASMHSSSMRSSATRFGEETEFPVDGKRGTILVVDDDEDACELMAAVLTRAGFEVIQAAGGAAAIKLFERHSAEISGVVLDYTMPLVGGGEVFDAIRNLRPNARILLVSGFAQARAADEMKRRGLVGFLQKPFVPADLVHNVELLIEDSASE